MRNCPVGFCPVGYCRVGNCLGENVSGEKMSAHGLTHPNTHASKLQCSRMTSDVPTLPMDFLEIQIANLFINIYSF